MASPQRLALAFPAATFPVPPRLSVFAARIALFAPASLVSRVGPLAFLPDAPPLALSAAASP